jgi:hypothetical protein
MFVPSLATRAVAKWFASPSLGSSHSSSNSKISGNSSLLALEIGTRAEFALSDSCDEGFSCLFSASASHRIHNRQELSLAEQFNAFVAVLSRPSLDLAIYLFPFFVGRIDSQSSQPLSDLDAHFHVTREV